MGLAWLRGDGSRSERSRLWKSLSGWVGWGATSQQSGSVRRKTEAASMASLGLWSSYLTASLSPLLRSQRSHTKGIDIIHSIALKKGKKKMFV